MARIFATSFLTLTAVLAVSALAFAEETIIEKRTYEEQRHSVEVVPAAPAVKERTVVEEQKVKSAPAVEKHTETTVTKGGHDDDDNDNE